MARGTVRPRPCGLGLNRLLNMRVISLWVLLLLLATAASAQVPRTISYQGVAVQNGSAVNGKHLITLSLYDAATGGNLIYQETHQTEIANGVFDLTIGSQSPFPLSLAFDKPYYLGVSFDGN